MGGSEESVVKFLEHLTNNKNNIVLDHVISDATVNFLDVTITKSESKLNTKVYFKSMDRNTVICLSGVDITLPVLKTSLRDKC